jgi:hypothetical protein
MSVMPICILLGRFTLKSRSDAETLGWKSKHNLFGGFGGLTRVLTDPRLHPLTAFIAGVALSSAGVTIVRRI